MSRIEDEIRWTFESEQEKAWNNVIYSSDWMKKFRKAIVKPYQISDAEYDVMKVLEIGKGIPLSIATIKNRLADKKNASGKVITALEEKGYIEACQSPNLHVFGYRITRSGVNFLNHVDDEVQDRIKNTFGRINQNEARLLNHLLDKLRG